MSPHAPCWGVATKISTRATKFAGEIWSSGVAVTLVVHEHKRLGCGIELAMLSQELKASDVGLEDLTGELKGSHDPSGIVFPVLAAMSGMERGYIRDRTLQGHESARKRGKIIGGAGVTDESMLSMALHLRDQEMSLRDIAARLVITTGKKKGQHPSAATVMRMLREHDGQTSAPLASWKLATLHPPPSAEKKKIISSSGTSGSTLTSPQQRDHSLR
ncbi:recombinase family protein [Streptomyces sp. NPDC006172]|uniref:recombinase family protein n=1 Tax=Streptomyces sp. NPDC006172 TaxID=3154470 RepID=UPI0033D2506B